MIAKIEMQFENELLLRLRKALDHRGLDGDGYVNVLLLAKDLAVEPAFSATSAQNSNFAHARARSLSESGAYQWPVNQWWLTQSLTSDGNSRVIALQAQPTPALGSSKQIDWTKWGCISAAVIGLVGIYITLWIGGKI